MMKNSRSNGNWDEPDRKVPLLYNKLQIHDSSIAHFLFLKPSAMTAAQKVMHILFLTSTMSSGSKNTMAPILRASEMAYFAFNFLSSSLSPAVSSSQFTISGSMAATK